MLDVDVNRHDFPAVQGPIAGVFQVVAVDNRAVVGGRQVVYPPAFPLHAAVGDLAEARGDVALAEVGRHVIAQDAFVVIIEAAWRIGHCDAIHVLQRGPGVAAVAGDLEIAVVVISFQVNVGVEGNDQVAGEAAQVPTAVYRFVAVVPQHVVPALALASLVGDIDDGGRQVDAHGVFGAGGRARGLAQHDIHRRWHVVIYHQRVRPAKEDTRPGIEAGRVSSAQFARPGAGRHDIPERR